jgi:hypothetical protein
MQGHHHQSFISSPFWLAQRKNRRRVCQQAAWLGLEFDDAAHEAGGPRITKARSKTSAWIFPTDEDLKIARNAWRLVADAGNTKNGQLNVRHAGRRSA